MFIPQAVTIAINIENKPVPFIHSPYEKYDSQLDKDIIWNNRFNFDYNNNTTMKPSFDEDWNQRSNRIIIDRIFKQECDRLNKENEP